jgi:sec-independent protein translocase protein TatC
MTVAAIITPPDLFSLFLVSIPLYMLYEFSISLSIKVEHKLALQKDKEIDE